MGSRLFLAFGKDLDFDMFKVGTILEKNWLNVSQSSSSVDMNLLSTMRLFFSPFDECWVNNGRTVLHKLLLPVMFLGPRFSKEDFLVFFKSFLQMFLWVLLFLLLVSVLCFRNLFLNLDHFMKGASLARLYFYLMGTWWLNILKIVLLYIRKSSTLEVAVTISYLNLALS